MAGEPDSFRVSPTTGALPLRDAPVVDNKGPEQVQQFGQAVSRVGGAAAAIYTDVLQRANQARVDEQLNRLKEAQLDATFGDNGFSRLKGRDALFRPDGRSLTEEYSADFENTSANLAGELTNQAQREAFNRAAGGMSVAFRGQLDQHSEQQFGVYNQSVLEGTLTNRAREIALSNDPEAINTSILSVRAAVYELSELTGRNSGEQIEADTRAALTPGLLANATRLLDANDVSAAEKFIDRYREHFTPDGLLKLDMAIGEAQDMKVATDVASEVLAGQVVIEETSAPQQLIMPVRANVSSSFGVSRGNGRVHKGVDLPVAVGTPVSAPAAGRLRYKDDPEGFGSYIEIDHGGGLVTRVAHLSSRGFEGSAGDGDYVTQGQIIGRSGGARGAAGAGNSRGPHVHYEVLQNGTQVDPAGRHSTAGGGGRRTVGSSLADMLTALRADPRVNSDPRRLAEAERQVRSMYGARQESEQQAEQDATDRAFAALAQNGGDWSKVPASVRSAVPGRALPSLMSFGENLRQPSGNATGDLATYGAVRAGIQSGEITRPEQILPYAPALGSALTKQLLDDVTGLKRGDQRTLDSLATTRGVMGWVQPELVRIGIDEKKAPEQFAQFRGKLLDQVARAERAKGGALTGDEANMIATSLLAQTVQDAPGWGSGNLRGYQLQRPVISYRAIPPAVRSQIEQSLIRRGIPPTQSRVRDEYYAATQAIGDQ